MPGSTGLRGMIPTLAPQASRLFRGGLAVGLGATALYVLAGQAVGGEALDGSLLAPILVFTTLAGALFALLGALAMPPTLPPAEPQAPEHAPTESVLRMAARAELWIARARRYLLLGGIAAGVVWTPLMVFGLTQGRGEGIWVARVTTTAGAIAFLAVALLWWRRVVEIDRELREWRLRIAKLQGLEKELLAGP